MVNLINPKKNLVTKDNEYNGRNNENHKGRTIQENYF